MVWWEVEKWRRGSDETQARMMTNEKMKGWLIHAGGLGSWDHGVSETQDGGSRMRLE